MSADKHPAEVLADLAPEHRDGGRLPRRHLALRLVRTSSNRHRTKGHPMTVQTLRHRITEALAEIGPMTSAELAHYLDAPRPSVSVALSRMSQQRPRSRPRSVHIAAWIHECDGERRYPRAVFGLGDKRDARKPRTTMAERERAYKARRSARRQLAASASSVFAFASSVGSASAD